jgi:hypothetical protein
VRALQRFVAAVPNATLRTMTLDQIKRAIGNLSSEDLAELRAWVAQFRRSAPQADPAPDEPVETPASKFGRLAGRAVADFKKRMRDT